MRKRPDIRTGLALLDHAAKIVKLAAWRNRPPPVFSKAATKHIEEALQDHYHPLLLGVQAVYDRELTRLQTCDLVWDCFRSVWRPASMKKAAIQGRRDKQKGWRPGRGYAGTWNMQDYYKRLRAARLLPVDVDRIIHPIQVAPDGPKRGWVARKAKLLQELPQTDRRLAS